MKDFRKIILQAFQFDWNSIKYAELSIPLNSGIAFWLYLTYMGKNEFPIEEEKQVNLFFLLLNYKMIIFRRKFLLKLPSHR